MASQKLTSTILSFTYSSNGSPKNLMLGLTKDPQLEHVIGMLSLKRLSNLLVHVRSI